MISSVGVVGLGYVGLPLVHEATRAGLRVAGYDVSSRTVEGLSAGRSHIDGITDADVQSMLDAGLSVSTDPAVLADVDVIVVCVPTPLSDTGGPDLSAVTGAAEAISGVLRSGQLVVLESTTYPGTTEDVFIPILEKSGLKVGTDFWAGFSPERVDPGNATFTTKNTPKVVGGIDGASTDAMEEFYSQVVDTVVRASGTREAESAKLLENTYRHLNIALVNELARVFHELGIDVWEVVRLAATKPFGFQAFYPGPGVGGHCIPIDPNYLNHHVMEQLGYPLRLVEVAEEINVTMPAYVVSRGAEILNQDKIPLNGATVLLLGVTYKPNISDVRESPSTGVAERLMDQQAVVSYHDPHVPTWSAGGQDLTCVEDLGAAVAQADLVILLQNHADYDADALAGAAARFLDTRGVIDPKAGHRL